MQRLHHGAYVDYLEVARIEMLRDIGVSYAQLEAQGYALPVTGLSIDYLGAASFDELVILETQIQCSSPVRMRFYYELFVKERRIANASVELACINLETTRPTRIPKDFLAQLLAISS
jgi:acyl-CoA thioester hydrolase